MSTVKFKVDGKPVAIDATAGMPLLYALRNAERVKAALARA
jgi:aerobic-type carbon monoxide dehydrogenase small subunit (CoxS/CutS family)